MFDLRQLHALAAVIDCGGFDRAARRLHLTQSAVSQRVRQLEEQLGQSLIVRSQPLRPTPAGQQLLRHYRQVSLLQAELQESLGAEAQPYTRLPIGLNADSLATWFIGAVVPLLAEGGLLLDLRVDDQDRTHQLLRSGEVMGCISASDRPIQGCRCLPLGTMIYRALATPAFRDHHFAAGVDADSLMEAPLVAFNHKDALQDRYLAAFLDGRAETPPHHLVPSPEAFLALIGTGLAWGMIPDQQVGERVRRGELVELTPERPMPVALYWHCWNLETRASKRLTEALVAHARLQLSPLASA